MKKKKHFMDLILIAIVLTLSGIFYLGNRHLFSAPAYKVEISVDGEAIQTLDLNEDTELIIEGYHGGTNHLVIKDGRICVTEATCPDKVCVHQGWISQTGESLVCLPNRMIATITGE